MKETVFEIVVIILMSLGIFGNINVIIAVLRKKILRTKGSMFVLLLTMAHLVCNIYEITGLHFRFRFRPMERKRCFQYNIAYFFSVMFQAALYLVMAVDLSFSIMFPIRHMLWKKRKYIALMALFPILYASTCVSLSYIYIIDGISPYCLFMITPDPMIYQTIATSSMVCSGGTLIIILCSIVYVLRKAASMKGNRHSVSSRSGSMKDEKQKMFRSTFFLIAIYMISWMGATICFKLAILFARDEHDLIEWSPYIAMVVMPSYCQAYFVSYMRSPRFRRAYREHLNVLTCGRLFPGIFNKAVKGSSINSAPNQIDRAEIKSQSLKMPKNIKFQADTIRTSL